MKLEILSEVKSAVNPKGSTKVCIDIPHSLVQEMADKWEEGDFEQALNVIAESLKGQLVYVDEWFNY